MTKNDCIMLRITFMSGNERVFFIYSKDWGEDDLHKEFSYYKHPEHLSYQNPLIVIDHEVFHYEKINDEYVEVHKETKSMIINLDHVETIEYE